MNALIFDIFENVALLMIMFHKCIEPYNVLRNTDVYSCIIQLYMFDVDKRL